MLLPNPAGTDPLGGARALATMVWEAGKEGCRFSIGFSVLSIQLNPRISLLLGVRMAGLLCFGGRERKKIGALPLRETLAKPERSRRRLPRRGHPQLQGVHKQGTFDFWPPALFFRAIRWDQAVPGGSGSKAGGCQRKTPIARLLPSSNTAGLGAEKGLRDAPAPATAVKLSTDGRGWRSNSFP